MIIVVFTTVVWSVKQIESRFHEKNTNNPDVIVKTVEVAPTTFPVGNSIQARFRPQNDPTQEVYDLKCTRSASELIEFEEFVNKKPKDIERTELMYGCYNQDQHMWIVQARQVRVPQDFYYVGGAENDFYDELYLIELDNKTAQKLNTFNGLLGIGCESRFKWQKDGWLYFECDASTFVYYDGNKQTYYVEACNSTQTTCISLCSQDASCRSNHFCNKDLNICTRECEYNGDCEWPYNGKCIVNYQEEEQYVSGLGMVGYREKAILACGIEDFE